MDSAPHVLNCGAIGTTLRSCTRFHTQVLAFGRCSLLEPACPELWCYWHHTSLIHTSLIHTSLIHTSLSHTRSVTGVIFVADGNTMSRPHPLVGGSLQTRLPRIGHVFLRLNAQPSLLCRVLAQLLL